MSINPPPRYGLTDPGQLPPELFDEIYDCAFPISDSIGFSDHCGERFAGFATCLSQIARFNHAWNRHITPWLYSSFKCNGGKGPCGKLWRCFRTVVEKPALAAMIASVEIQDCDGPCPPNAFLSMDEQALEARLHMLPFRGFEGLR